MNASLLNSVPQENAVAQQQTHPQPVHLFFPLSTTLPSIVAGAFSCGTEFRQTKMMKSKRFVRIFADIIGEH